MKTKEAFSQALYSLPSSRKEYLEKLSIPSTPAGNESKIYRVGDKITAAETAPYRGSGEIKEIYFENGFARYMVKMDASKKNASLLMFRQKDIAGSDYVAKCHEAGKELFREFAGDLARGMRKGRK